MAVSIPDQYGYVLLAATSTFFINTIHMIRTSKFRKAAKIDYPASYATDEQVAKDRNAFKFNCAQRSHSNFTENHTSALGAMLVAGIQYPLASAALGGVWALGRVMYLYGYTGDAGPKGRVHGFMVSSLADLALKFVAAYAAYGLIAIARA